MMAEPKYHHHDSALSSAGLVHIRHSIIWHILPELIFFTMVAVMITIVSERLFPLQIATTLTTVFGSVLGFLISFRTSAAYASYQEGRKHWSSIILASRSFSRMAWIHVPDAAHPNADLKAPVDEDDVRLGLIEKTSALRLVGAFSVALKHYCRGEAGVYYEDLYPLVCYLPKCAFPHKPIFSEKYELIVLYVNDIQTACRLLRTFHGPTSTRIIILAPPICCDSSPSSTVRDLNSDTHERAQSPLIQSASSSGIEPSGSALLDEPCVESFTDPYTGEQTNRIKSPHQLLPSRNPPPISWDEFIPFYALMSDLWGLLRRGQRKIRHRVAGRTKNRKRRPLQSQKDGDNVPLEITLFLSGWVSMLQRRKSIDVPTTNVLLATLQSLTDSLTGLERVLLSPMPIAYALHLRHVIWLYLLLLPSQLYSSFKWLTVPATALITFVFIGFLQIGNEIDDPLGYDASDLDLESYTQTILRELRELIAHPASESNPEHFFFVESNLPFAQSPDWTGLSAKQIVKQHTSITELLRLLKEERKPIPMVPSPTESSSGGDSGKFAN